MRGLLELSTEISLVLPRRVPSFSPRLRILTAGRSGESRDRAPRARRPRLRIRRVRTLLKPYLTEEVYEEELLAISRGAARRPGLYGPNLHAEVLRYAEAAARIAAREPFDVIHAHDWLTFLAGMRGEEGERQAPRPPRARHRVRPLRPRRRRLRRRRRAGRTRGGRPGRRRVRVHGRGPGRAGTASPANSLRVVHNAIDVRAHRPRLDRRRGRSRWSSSRAGSRGRRAPTTSSTPPPASPRRCPPSSSRSRAPATGCGP